MNVSTRRLLGFAAVVAACAVTMGPAAAQWGRPGATYAHAPRAHAPGYPQASFYGYGGQALYGNAPYYIEQSPYGYNYSYGYGIYGRRRRGLVDWDDWSPFGEREIEYEYRRDGTVEVDIDD